MYRIAEKKTLAPDIHSIKIEAPLVARKARPGHFVILRLHQKGERIPLTVVGTEPARGLVWLVFQAVGKTTRELALCKEGQAVMDLVGPLGTARPAKKLGTVICVGGGVGLAPVLPRAMELKQAGNRVVTIAGARTRELLILREQIEEASHAVHYCTDDGSFGTHGFVTTLLPEVAKAEAPVAEVLAIGPVPMMRAVCNVTRELGLKTTVSLNALMVDGTGMCGACRVTVGGKVLFTCVDGPEFDGHMVDFAELSNRQRQYLEEEKLAVQRFEEGGEHCLCQSV